MKNSNLISAFGLVLGLTFYACKGPEGPVGPAGPTGTQGAVGAAGANGTNGKDGSNGAAGVAGATGAQGPMGNANVVYSDWITINWSNNGQDDAFLSLRNKDTKMPLITQEAIDKSLIYIYFKGNARLYNEDTKEFYLSEQIAPNYINSYFKIPGRNTNNWWDFTNVYGYASQQIGVNFMESYGQLYLKGYKIVNNAAVPETIPELAGKSFTEHNELIKNLVKYRVIIVNGSTKGRLSAVDMNNYDAVCKALNISK